MNMNSRRLANATDLTCKGEGRTGPGSTGCQSSVADERQTTMRSRPVPNPGSTGSRLSAAGERQTTTSALEQAHGGRRSPASFFSSGVARCWN